MPPQPLRYGEGHRYDSGLRYGQLLPDPPEPKSSRQTASTYTAPSTPMNFTFIVKPSTDGEKFTTRPAFGPNWTQAELDALVSAAHGVPPETCRAIGRQYFLELLNAATPRRCLRLFDLLYTRPSSGGVQESPDDFHTPTDIKADLVVGYLAEVIRDWREPMTIAKVGQEGVAIPVIDSILNEFTGLLNKYTAIAEHPARRREPRPRQDEQRAGRLHRPRSRRRLGAAHHLRPRHAGANLRAHPGGHHGRAADPRR